MDVLEDNLDLQISPTYILRDLKDARDSYDMRVKIFEDRTKGWFFDHAKSLTNSGNQHVGFAVLKLLFSYFEMIAQYMEGMSSRGNSGPFFKRGVVYVFPELSDDPWKDDLLNLLWISARNGFFHSGMTQHRVFIRDSDAPIVFEDGKIYIDRFKFPERIYQHFDEYIEELKTSFDPFVRDHFSFIWRQVNGGKFYPISY
ncbi:MAG: hypothetical protein AAB383_00890 [Patescibacteria group bacterium]|mgnify:FL=1